ncbi:MAG: adenylate/guanylate cyclase domain-containing protein [Rhodocyclaceae bacterium]|nr:adenylate/guanylate cyclase domain-containing protein [Rhodocyclaceae bacterium]
MASALLSRLHRHAWLLAVAATLSATLAAEGLYRSGAAQRIEYLYSDFWHRLAGPRHTPDHVALVMIDDPSLNARPDEPLPFWTPHFATALATLKAAGVRIVAIDFIFSGSPERWIAKLGLQASEASRAYDRPFRAEINRGGVVLSAFRLGAGASADDFVLPSPDYLLALPDMDMVANIGLANLRDDADGTVRRFVVAEPASAYAEKQGLPRLPFAALAAVLAAGQDPHARRFAFGDREFAPADALPIAFAGPPGTFRPVSFATLLRPDALALPEVRALAGKVVILGAGFAGMNDVHPTPYSTSLGGANRLMFGAEIQANIVETLLGGRSIATTPAAARLAVFLLAFGLLAVVGLRLSPARAVALVVVAMLASAAAAYLLFAHDILFPIAHLHLGMAIVLAGLALLRLTREERERARIGTLFGRYVSAQVVAGLLAAPELPELGGQAQRITVLFADIRNFTAISEKLSAREVVEMLNAYFERACAVLLAEGASIDKFIGDAVMAEFGTPLPQPDHALRALRAAVALRDVAEQFRAWMTARFPGRGLPEFAVGIGVHSGEAVVGNIGSSMRMEYTAIGDTVNLASRLEGRTKDTGCVILASAATVAAAGAAAITGARFELTVKGRVQAVDAFEIVGVADAPAPLPQRLQSET